MLNLFQHLIFKQTLKQVQGDQHFDMTPGSFQKLMLTFFWFRHTLMVKIRVALKMQGNPLAFNQLLFHKTYRECFHIGGDHIVSVGGDVPFVIIGSATFMAIHVRVVHPHVHILAPVGIPVYRKLELAGYHRPGVSENTRQPIYF